MVFLLNYLVPKPNQLEKSLKDFWLLTLDAVFCNEFDLENAAPKTKI